jgi:hypothetical protein
MADPVPQRGITTTITSCSFFTAPTLSPTVVVLLRLSRYYAIKDMNAVQIEVRQRPIMHALLLVLIKLN